LFLAHSPYTALDPSVKPDNHPFSRFLHFIIKAHVFWSPSCDVKGLRDREWKPHMKQNTSVTKDTGESANPMTSIVRPEMSGNGKGQAKEKVIVKVPV
jgi:hypothetical protein